MRHSGIDKRPTQDGITMDNSENHDSMGQTDDTAKKISDLENLVKGLNRKIEERDKRINEYRELSKLSRTLVRDMIDGYGMIDEKGTIISCNENFCEMLGYTPESIVGRSIYEFIENSYKDSLKKKKNNLRFGEGTAVEVVYKRNNGLLVRTNFSTRQVNNPKNNLKCFYFIITGLTELQHMQDKLELYEALVENVYTGLIVYQLEDREYDYSLRLVYANPAASLFSGTNINDLIGKKILDAFTALANSDLPRKFAEVARNQKSEDLGEIIYGDERIKRSYFAIKAFGLPNDCVGVGFYNINERKKMEMEKLRKEKLEGVLEMARTTNHELNQPLQVIYGYSELARRKGRSKRKMREAFDILIKSVERIRDITNNIDNITKYKSKEYINGSSIIDLERSAD